MGWGRIGLVTALTACGGDPVRVADAGPEPDAPAIAPVLRRLTEAEYGAAARALLGPDVALPTVLEPDEPVDGLLAVGASVAATSSLGVERYEDAAYLLADQADWGTLLPCTPSSASDAACAEAFVSEVGRRAWRRPLTDDEVARVAGVVTAVGSEAGDFEVGARYGLAALLQSPHFVYRVELGTDGELSAYELASRLSFLLWAAPPDDALLDQAAAGDLDTRAGVRRVAEAMLDDPRADDGIRGFVDDWLRLYDVPTWTKDPTAFDHAHPDLGPSAREETLRLFTAFALGPDDIRDLFTTRMTALDPRLAALYRVPAPDPDGFAWTRLPEGDGRAGILGHASILGLASHASRSSATLRGKYIRTQLLCQEIPEPPADVDTSIPEPDATSPTLRDRIAVHLEDPTCAACHGITDPLGLSLENFDGIGRWRDTENGVAIDPSGSLDGTDFDDALGLGQAMHDHPDLLACWSDRLMAYGAGLSPEAAQEPRVLWLSEVAAANGHQWRELLLAFATSEGFRSVGEDR